ncbi:hypothetical protein AVEN_268279-1 [Araneus ventricosus]|uniref:FHA domain-containing protein n=1 Tax=Araneus ventricosus TaxID=182803 RepID=A0A4Y2C4E3_ARAVE|nr:hypothetical protein AVEN_268279-1 [Araneus ventricosus]
MLEKGRLYSLRKDGTKDSLYLNIKNKRFLFGSSEYCTVRIYINGIFPEHCVLTIGGQGKAYLEPLHPSALTLVNGIKIKHKVCLEDNDVVTIFIKEFQFAYPPDSSSRNASFERLILPYSKQMKPAQKFKILTLGKNWETSHPFRESSVSNINYIPKKQICIIESDILKKIPEYLLKFTHQEPVNILYEKMNAQEVNSCSDKSLIKYMNQYVKESPEERRNLALKLYEFISFLRGLLNRNEVYLYDLWPILESVLKYCIARASEDIFFLPLKSLNLKAEITVHKKYLQSRILSYTSKNSSPVSDTMSEKENRCINSFEVGVSSNCKMEGQKQNQYSSRKISISYKKRVSLAVKRYHLRKRKSIMMVKAAEIGSVENLELSGERPRMNDRCREIDSNEQNVVLNLEKQQTTRTKRKRVFNKKEKEGIQDKGDLKIKQEISMEVVKDPIGKLNTTSEQMKEKRRNKKAAAKKTDLKPGKENIAELTDNSSGNQVTIPNLREQKQSKEKQNSKNKGLKQESEKESTECSVGEQTTNMKLTETKATKRSYKRKKKEALTNKTGKSTQECDTQELSRCQRITRSMAKKCH